MSSTLPPPDPRWMREAVSEARKGSGLTHPNPMVGAVAVREGVAVGRGFHRGPGTPHAEVMALRDAGAAGARCDLYVTLEPCCTYGRTPPCTDLLIGAGVRRVIGGCEDPNPEVRGHGYERLREAGILVEEGFLIEEAVGVDPAYHIYHTERRPFVFLKWAQSLDGRASLPGGGYLTGEPARRIVHRDRRYCDAILVTAGTILKDDPLLTVRTEGPSKKLLRIILDRRGRITGRERVFGTCPERGGIRVVRPEGLGIPAPPGEGVDVMSVSAWGDGGDALGAVLADLYRERVMALYVEGVGRLSRLLLEERLLHRLSIHIAPVLIGEAGTVPAVGGDRSGDRTFPDLGRARWRRAGSDWIATLDFFDVPGHKGG